jgi:hypothetical protein
MSFVCHLGGTYGAGIPWLHLRFYKQEAPTEPGFPGRI